MTKPRFRRSISYKNSVSAKNDECGGVFDIKFGKALILESPGYLSGEGYKLNQKCTFLIRVKIFSQI